MIGVGKTMRTAEFQKLLAELGKLDAGQRAAAIRMLSGVDETRQAIEIWEAGSASGPACPHCGHAHVRHENRSPGRNEKPPNDQTPHLATPTLASSIKSHLNIESPDPDPPDQLASVCPKAFEDGQLVGIKLLDPLRRRLASGG